MRKKPIGSYTDKELNIAIADAEKLIPNFWVIMRGVDAYMERRERRRGAAQQRDYDYAMASFNAEKSWGDS